MPPHDRSLRHAAAVGRRLPDGRLQRLPERHGKGQLLRQPPGGGDCLPAAAAAAPPPPCGHGNVHLVGGPGPRSGSAPHRLHGDGRCLPQQRRHIASTGCRQRQHHAAPSGRRRRRGACGARRRRSKAEPPPTLQGEARAHEEAGPAHEGVGGRRSGRVDQWLPHNSGLARPWDSRPGATVGGVGAGRRGVLPCASGTRARRESSLRCSSRNSGELAASAWPGRLCCSTQRAVL
mmetsp:Transcript_14115/g.40630  ORF Transcript_14115/g.40630 Transcript_14115/m.40630 type:complete len:234 (+) Transcript_14115:495-1196(+)